MVGLRDLLETAGKLRIAKWAAMGAFSLFTLVIFQIPNDAESFLLFYGLSLFFFVMVWVRIWAHANKAGLATLLKVESLWYISLAFQIFVDGMLSIVLVFYKSSPLGVLLGLAMFISAYVFQKERKSSFVVDH